MHLVHKARCEIRTNGGDAAAKTYTLEVEQTQLPTGADNAPWIFPLLWALVKDGKVVAEGSPAELNREQKDVVRQFMSGTPDGPVPFHYPAPDYFEQLLQATDA